MEKHLKSHVFRKTICQWCKPWKLQMLGLLWTLSICPLVPPLSNRAVVWISLCVRQWPLTLYGSCRLDSHQTNEEYSRRGYRCLSVCNSEIGRKKGGGVGFHKIINARASSDNAIYSLKLQKRSLSFNHPVQKEKDFHDSYVNIINQIVDLTSWFAKQILL